MLLETLETHPTERLRDKVCIVTEVAGPVAAACALRLASEGARMVVADQDRAAANFVVSTIRQLGGRAVALTASSGDAGQVEELVERTLERHGRLDAFVHPGLRTNPDAGLDRSPADPPSAWCRELRRQLQSLTLGCHQALPPMVAAGGGALVAVSCTLGPVAPPGSLAARAEATGDEAMADLVRRIAEEYRPQGVRANLVLAQLSTANAAEDAVDRGEGSGRPKPMTTLGPEDVAGAVAFFASQDAGHVSGVVLRLGVPSVVPAQPGLTNWPV
ncbi:MAG TPA: SDR family oxidoreductase [Armatimonadota bacterium]